LPSRDLVFPPSTLRGSGDVQLTPRGKTQARSPAERKPPLQHLSSEPACASSKVTGGEFVANLGRPRPDVLKAVIAHLWNSVGSPFSPMTLAHLRPSRITNAARQRRCLELLIGSGRLANLYGDLNFCHRFGPANLATPRGRGGDAFRALTKLARLLVTRQMN
jgi:hypothetical protein